MKWRGQGVVTVVVLAAAAMFGYQWVSMTGMVDKVTYEGIEYSQYTKLVSQFVEEQKRWPEPHEVAMPKPPRKGVIKAAKLQNNGEILFVLSGWGIQSGRVTVLLSPKLSTQSSLLPGSHTRLSYNCTTVNPISYQRLLCGSFDTNTSAEINSINAHAFAEWEKNESETKNNMTTHKLEVDAASATPTQCDVHLLQTEERVVPCLIQIDEQATEEVKAYFQTKLNRPRLRPEIIVNNPDLVAQYNSECDNQWDLVSKRVKAKYPKFEGCF